MEGNYLSRNTTHKDKDCFSFEEHTLHTWGTSSWPCRNYVCSFCKREFKSAQALGGHMNVHRRDRARLRSSLSNSESPKPNPSIIKPNNPTHLSDDYFLNCDPLYGPCLTLSASSLSSPASTSTGDKKPRLSSSQLPFLSPQSKRSALGVDQELKGCALMEEEHKVFKNNNDNITLELGIGSLLKHPKEKLDLELRLGQYF